MLWKDLGLSHSWGLSFNRQNMEPLLKRLEQILKNILTTLVFTWHLERWIHQYGTYTTSSLAQQLLWEDVQNNVDVQSGYLIVDDTILDKPRGSKIEGVGFHDSGNHKRSVRGWCLVCLVWTDWKYVFPVDFRIYNKIVLVYRSVVRRIISRKVVTTTQQHTRSIEESFASQVPYVSACKIFWSLVWRFSDVWAGSPLLLPSLFSLKMHPFTRRPRHHPSHDKGLSHHGSVAGLFHTVTSSSSSRRNNQNVVFCLRRVFYVFSRRHVMWV